ncbi:HNH endonuclease signature motif containing protein [Ralstonia thomasii]|uniref:HNH endonuclease signature motif containing protein n=1 Tax=Ralstonia thomasii TaxID=3058596 RepID=UPI00292D8F2C|nr:HNH endonuclease signature motif containing protein [Ralstonia sp. LMG 18095]
MKLLKDRLEEKMERIPESGCWIWMGALDRDGYGQIGARGKSLKAHRASYEMFTGPIPKELHIDHLCRVRACCNPHHLEPVTPRENVLRSEGVAAACAVKTCCVNGHPYDETNTGVHNNKRYCRECKKKRNREYTARNRLVKERASPLED